MREIYKERERWSKSNMRKEVVCCSFMKGERIVRINLQKWYSANPKIQHA